jgi:hypothetical protein
VTTAIQTELPSELIAAAQQLIQQGWASDLNQLIAEALRRYLDSHTAGLAELFLKQDIEWGLHGRD